MTRSPPTHRRVERKSHPALIERDAGFKSLKDAWANTTTIELFSTYGIDFAKERTADAQFALGKLRPSLCVVPLDRRGPKPRPDECDDGASTRSHK